LKYCVKKVQSLAGELQSVERKNAKNELGSFLYELIAGSYDGEVKYYYFQQEFKTGGVRH